MSQKVTFHYRIKLAITLLLFFIVGYGFTNRFPVFTPKYLPLTAVDKFFGFHPWTVWVYMSDYFLMFLPVFLMPHIEPLKKIAKGFFLNFAIHYPIFFFFPTTISRPALIEENFTNFAFNIMRMVDTPMNCFPSQHVSLCYIIALGFWNYKRKYSILFLIWATLISLSTLTTKQHYVWDVLGGLIVAAVVCFFAFKKRVDTNVKLVAPSQ